MLNFAILILNMSFFNNFYALPDALGAKDVFLFYSAMVCESIEYVIIVFQGISIEVL